MGRLERLALGKLALFAGAFEAELLAFFFSGVAAEQIGTLEGALEVFVHDGQGFADAEADGFGLALVAAAGNDGADVKLIDIVEQYEGFLQFAKQVLAAGQVVGGWLVINGDSALAGAQADAGRGALAAADGVKVIVFGHYLLSFNEILIGCWGSCLCSASP